MRSALHLLMLSDVDCAFAAADCAKRAGSMAKLSMVTEG